MTENISKIVFGFYLSYDDVAACRFFLIDIANDHVLRETKSASEFLNECICHSHFHVLKIHKKKKINLFLDKVILH